MRRRINEGDVQVELIEAKSTHRRFLPRVAAYELIQLDDGQFRVLERPRSASAMNSKKCPRPPIPSRAVRAVHKQRATSDKQPYLESLATTRSSKSSNSPGVWRGGDDNSGDSKHDDKLSVLEAALVDKVKWREAAVQEMMAASKTSSRQSTTRVLKLMQCAAVVRQLSVDVVNALKAWRHHSMDTTKEFRWLGRNYLVQMANDLDWLGDEGMLAHALGIPTCTNNPLLCAITLTDPHWQRYCAAPTPARLAQLQATLHMSNEVDGDMLLTILAVIANELDRHPHPLVVVLPVEGEIDVPLNDVSNASLALPHNEDIDDCATAARRPLIVSCFYAWLQRHDLFQRYQRARQKRDTARIQRLFLAWHRHGLECALARRVICRRAFATWQYQMQRWRTAKLLRRQARRRLARAAIHMWRSQTAKYRAARHIAVAWLRHYRNSRQKRTRMQMTSTAAGNGHELQLMRVKLQTVQARSIQRRWRDMVAQQKWELKLQTVQAESARMNQQLQARIIQSKWRVLRVQLQQQRNVHAVAVQQWWRLAKSSQVRRGQTLASARIQMWWRQRTKAQRRRRCVTAARTVQSWWRARRVRRMQLRVASTGIQMQWRNCMRRWHFRCVFRPLTTAWLVQGTMLAIQQRHRWRSQASRRLQRCWAAYRLRVRTHAQTVLAMVWRLVTWRRQRRRAVLSIQKAYRTYVEYRWWLWHYRMATRIQRLVRAFLRRRRAAKTLIAAARNFLSKKVWSTAVALGTTAADEPYYALWISQGAAYVSCIQNRTLASARIQMWWRKRAKAQRRRRCVAAARTVQSWWRARRVRRMQLRIVAYETVLHVVFACDARRVASTGIQMQWRNCMRRWHFRCVFRPLTTAWLVQGTMLAIQQRHRWRSQASRRLQRCWAAYRLRVRTHAQTVLAMVWRLVTWRRQRRRAVLSIQKAYRTYVEYRWWLWHYRMATRIQRLVRAFLRRRRAAKTLIAAARNFLSKKVWSTAVALGTTAADEPYYALWLSQGVAYVSCIQRRKRGSLQLDKATWRVLNALHMFRSSKVRTKDWEFAALEVLGQVEVVETDTTIQLTMPPEYALGKVLHRSESLAQVNKTKTTKRTLTVLDAAAGLSIPDLLDSLNDNRDVNERDAAGQTPLHVVVAMPHDDKQHDVMDILLEHGADVHAKDYDGVTPLMILAGHGHPMLLDKLMHVARLDAVDNKGYTALHHACAKNNRRACELLIETARDRCGSLNCASYDGTFPLHVLAILGHVECACVLQQENTWNVNVRDAEGRSPLHLAIAYNHSTFVTFLLEMGADPDVRDVLSRTPLHYAMECKCGLEMVSSLRKFKVDLNAADERGDTALHWAAHSGHQKLVNHLVNLGADTLLQNSDWETPAQLAAANGYEGCVAIFSRASKKKPQFVASPTAAPVTSYVSMESHSEPADATKTCGNDLSSEFGAAAMPDVEASQWVYDEFGGCYDTATGTYWSPDGLGGYYDASQQVAYADNNSIEFSYDNGESYGDTNNYDYGAAENDSARAAENAKPWSDY
ncbi:hypothetical protein H257_01660 [Aphanomyces astaci]|uniref:Uncharacterized protein n=1 Tax=Aphanomyces astaci TaxID=112090 RepID=W4H4D9_APHAT|nr:hypothetical protein H257_01660 [Aphanomyces astaci]ETV86471.1 hypothetical protein H257_01660 [Aphanomyces astaci]|eukprot:XP_009823270.1 hypothetical protein H257_01660 [Aphanomyces astaci]